MSSGFKRSVADASLFIQHHHLAPIYIIVYVDDIILASPDSEILNTFIERLAKKFALKDLGSLSYFLGVEVVPTPQGLFLSQKKYIVDLLQRTSMAAANPAPTPMTTDSPLTLHSGSLIDNPTEYRAIVGSLQYLSLTRPDVAFVVNKLSQYMHMPRTTHWSALKRLLRYLVGSLDKGISIRRDSPLVLHAFSDADWAGNKDDYTSTIGQIVFLGRNPLSWSSKKQRFLSQSSTEAEYKAVSSTAGELLWLQNLLHEMGVSVPETPVIYSDNLGATYLSANPVFHSRMKHLALAFHFVREQVQAGNLRVTHVPSGDQLADALTKPLTRTRLELLMSKIGLSHQSSVLRGNVKDET